MVKEIQEIDPKIIVNDALIAIGQDQQAFFMEEDQRFVVYRSDLHKLMAMGLSDLPIEAIGMTDDCSVLHLEGLQLIKTLNISNKLTEYFPGYMVAALYELESLMKKGGYRAYVIGGKIRDLLLHQERQLEVEDVDITIEGDAISSSQFIVNNSKNFSVDECFAEFGTVKLNYKGRIQFDLASTRKEIYRKCGALPEVVERGVDLSDDIIRRDFTANSLAMSIHELGHILDHTNGIDDIEHRQIHVLHPVSFFEDPSRVLRAFKFLARLDFSLTPSTEHLIGQFLRYGVQVYNGGGERIKDELREFLSTTEKKAKGRWLNYFRDSGSLRLVNMAIPESRSKSIDTDQLDLIYRHWPLISERLDKFMAPGALLWGLYMCMMLANLIGTDDDELFVETAKRLGLTRGEREWVEKFVILKQSDVLRHIEELSSPVDIYDAFSNLSVVSVVAAALVQFGDHPNQLKTIINAFYAYKEKFEHIKPELNGNDLMELGVPEGEEIGKLLKELLQLKLIGRLSERMAEIRFVRQKLGIVEPPKTDHHLEDDSGFATEQHQGDG